MPAVGRDESVVCASGLSLPPLYVEGVLELANVSVPSPPPTSIRRRVVILAFNEQGNRVGETHHNARIPDEIVDRIRERHEDDSPQPIRWGGNGAVRTLRPGYRTLAREFGLSIWTVRNILTYQRRAQTPTRYKRVTIAVMPVTPPPAAQ